MKQKEDGACGSFVLCLDYVAISPFIYFNQRSNNFLGHPDFQHSAFSLRLSAFSKILNDAVDVELPSYVKELSRHKFISPPI